MSMEPPSSQDTNKAMNKNHNDKTKRAHRRKPWIRTQIILFSIILIIFVVSFSLLIGLKMYATGKLEVHIAAVRDTGGPTTIEELIHWQEDFMDSQGQPDESTAAALYSQVFSAIDDKDNPHPLDELRQLVNGMIENNELPAAEPELLRKELMERQALLALLYQAVALPAGHYDPDYSQIWQLDLPYLSGTRRALLLLRAEICRALIHKEADQASRAFIAAGALLRPYYYEPTLSSQYARIYCVRLIQRIFNLMLNHVEFTGDQLTQFRDVFEFPSLKDAFSRTLIAERVWMIQSYLNPELLIHASDKWIYSTSMSDKFAIAGSVGWWIPDYKLYFTAMERLIPAITQTFPEAQLTFYQEIYPRSAYYRAPTAAAQQEPRLRMRLPAWPGLEKLRENYINLPEAIAGHDLNIAFALTALQVEQYRAEHGQWPESLDSLIPEYGADLPVDPYTLEPLVYSIEEEGGYKISTPVIALRDKDPLKDAYYRAHFKVDR
ncbi:MAG: hypothetical protein GX117_14270 [Candidatus Hydrogenedentes bacterium]|nr:hypothetical protein [Candidatus Hydrogenedentota bacterium]